MRTRRAIGLLAAGAAGASTALAQPLSPLAGPVEVFQLGRSQEGHALSGWRLARPEPDALGRGPDERPALLIVAGLDGRHDFGTRLALTLIDRLVTEHAELLESRTVYIVPDLNPDNDALFDRPGAPRAAFGRAPRPLDADADGRVAEDPGEDLNGDSMITMMRVRRPAPGTGLTATLVADPDEPRLLRAPDGSKGEIAEYALLVEGIDNDGDGKFNEDGVAGSAGGGVDLDRNFPALWPEHEDGAGRYQLSEPETRRLVEWMLERDNIVCVLAFTSADNIINTPGAGKFAPDGREPSGIEEGDRDAYEKVRETFKEITGQTGAPGRDWAGSFTQWAYGHFGVYSFATPGWVRPNLVQRAEDGGERAEKPDGEGGGPAPPPDPDAERRALQERGVPQFLIDFIVATPEERGAMVAEFGSLTEQEQAERMAAVAALPQDLQLRVRALISGQPDPARAGGGGGRRDRASRPGAGGESDEAAWIRYSDEHLGGRGFAAWTPFDHPQLGGVEIGGLVPGVTHEPPEGEWGRVADEQTEFVSRLLGLLPELRVEALPPERLARGVWRVRVRGSNPGGLPTAGAIGVKARRVAPIVVSIGVAVEDIVAGQRVERWDAIGAHGAHADAEWVIRAPDGATVPVEVRSSVFGDRVIEIVLEEGE